MKTHIELVVLDMAGTTIQDNSEEELCFMQAIKSTGLTVPRDKVLSRMGGSKFHVIETLWRERLWGQSEELINEMTMLTDKTYIELLESHFSKFQVQPVKGCYDLFMFLREHKIKVALNTDLNRKIADLMLEKINWSGNRAKKTNLIDLTICCDEVIIGRPAPYMIFKAMEFLNIQDVRKVIKIGDSPSDLAEGKNAGCLYSLGIASGSYSKEQLQQYDNDGIMRNLFEVIDFLEEWYDV